MSKSLDERKILLIEDNPGDARLIREYISATNWRECTEWVSSIQEARKILERTAFDAVLLDLHLPDSRGLDTLESIIAVSPDVPVIVLTGLDDDELGANAVRKGAQDYLAKVTLDEKLLRKSLSYAVARHYMSRQTRQLIDCNIDGVLVFSTEGILQYQNAAAEKFTSCCLPAEKFYTRIRELDWQDSIAHLTVDKSDDDTCVSCSGQSHCDGRSFELRSVDIDWEDSENASLIFMHEITEQLQARNILQQANIQLEERVGERTAELKWANSALKTLGDCNQIISFAVDEYEMLSHLCVTIVSHLMYPLVWIGFCENSGTTEHLRPAAWAGEYSKWFSTFFDNQGSIKNEFPIIEESLRYNRAIIRNDIVGHAFKSEMVLPLAVENTRAILCLHSEQENAFEFEDIQLLNKMANDIAYGISHLRLRMQKENLKRQLEQANKMEAIGQLTGGIAHDFNNMLGGILGYTSLAMQLNINIQDEEHEKLSRYLQQVFLAGERARELISQMMVFSRSGDSITIAPNDICKVTKDAMKMLRPLLPSSIDVHLHMPGTLPLVMTDAIKIHQTMMNLCVNARDAMDETGRLDIGVNLVAHHDSVCTSCHQPFSGQFVEIYVSDTGPGISTENLERIFEPFFTTKDVGKGTGMGLSTVHGVIHDHNGHIIVDTAVGRGTSFRLLIPLYESTQVSDRETLVSKPVSQGIAGDGRVIMVVDDDTTIAGFISELLRNTGFNVATYTNSLEAHREFCSSPASYDLVITDQTMPKMTGFDMATSMLEHRHDIPIILCTGYSSRIDREKAMSLGIRELMKKPVNSDELLHVISDLLVMRV